MKNRKGTLELGVLLLLVGGIAFGHLQYKAGEWGANGNDKFEVRQAKLEALGIHINNKDRWYENY